MAGVWLAHDRVLEREVAIKVLSDTIASDPEFLARFRREARVAASLSHPNLIGIYDYAGDAERPSLVLEDVAGDNLAERRSQKAEIDCGRLARELLGALAHIHAAGIVHRDVKPQNILIAPGGGAKLIDFGIALTKDASSLTSTGHLLGTALYIAPEVMSGKPATERSDLYSCGIVLRDCSGDNPSGRLRGLVARLSAADPGARPTSAEDAVAQVSRRASSPGQPTERLEPTLGYQRSEQSAHPMAGPPHRASGRAAAIVAVGVILAPLAIGLFSLIDGPGARSEKAQPRVATSDRDGTGERGGEETGATAMVPTPGGDDPALGGALNQEAFEMIQAGRHAEAIPVLEEAIRSFPPGTDDLNYAYALFNLGNALRLSGRPQEAIPVLERRLQIPNQTGGLRCPLRP